ncbi:uncharacterized protein CELE_C39B10.7 [Caenorhabditis elegans]|uniref:Transmembrane protein n=1 Tax=Caenorhabditis elegans TaxID=6239 RepID=G5ECK1_CAEEL|nr:Transmembrane protein [Caenorhabditis elegans]CAR97815.1 Transmembrane protein [Caenorhabditis elegans]|eukprot:NP_001257107.1 Uncharacterized protein CELE_C39B10.7 [Caenorhabditis elegans]
MVDIKTLTSPKVAIPIIGIVVLVVVSTLVAMFYVRNPTVTDNIFGNANTDEKDASGDSPLDHATQSSVGSSPSHVLQTTTSGSHGADSTISSTTSLASPVTLPMTPSSDSSTPMHAIEPVQHL